MRRERGGDNGERVKGYRNNCKGHMDNNKGWWKWGSEAGRAGVVGRGRGERQKIVLEQH